MSKYQQALIEHIERNPKFIQPDSRRNEILGFLRQPLTDLCISRPKSRLSWGIELPFDRDYVCYVWFDALLNYATAVGYQQSQRQADFSKWWQETGAVHILGKDIVTTHAVYWTTMLMALGIALPRQVFAHGWILNKDLEKMSKSKGDVINPLDLKDLVGVDGLRYYFVRDIHFGNDAPISQDLVVNRVNNDLANNLGNLHSRSSNLIDKYFGGKIPSYQYSDSEMVQLLQSARALPDLVRTSVEDMNPSRALEQIVQLLNEANRFLEAKAPWKTAKQDLDQAAAILVTSLEVVRVCAILLFPVMPKKMSELLSRLGIHQVDAAELRRFPGFETDRRVEKGDPLFPRIELSPK